ncbi:MAG: hypothetical protein IRZ14_03760 [Chloroflexi bacterium]|nr:hypothetical protein [Chloroflexota bacterium]
MRASSHPLWIAGLLGLVLTAAIALAPLPVAASTGDPAGTVAQYPTWYGYGYGGLPSWGNYYPGSGLAAWYDAYLTYGTVTPSYSYGVGYPSYSYGTYPWAGYSYPIGGAVSYSPYYGLMVYPGSGLYTTPAGTSFVVCPWYALYC